ncbi:MAG: NHL repeat-containing protein [Planctomycetes bacterium]|nr:NHL repeat-containing protein [Planctomycetota bacterium]
MHWLALAAALLAGGSYSLDPFEGSNPVQHAHEPLVIDGVPIVARVPIPVVQPSAVAVDRGRNIYVADAGLGAVYRRSAAGENSVAAEGLEEPAGLAVDADGRLYVAEYAGGRRNRGSVVRLTRGAESETIAQDLTGPQGLAFDADGRLHVALSGENRVVRIGAKGGLETAVDNLPAPTAIAFTHRNELLVVCPMSGSVYRLSADGRPHVLAGGLDEPSSVAVDALGHVVITCLGSRVILRLDPASGRLSPLCVVPLGTSGAAFDADDNLLVVNREHGLLLKITTTLFVPCPHCGKKIPVRIRPRIDPAEPDKDVL